jgi:hypothetical protein
MKNCISELLFCFFHDHQLHSIFAFVMFCLTMLRGFPVATAWRVLGLWIEERPTAMEVAANILNKQPQTNDKGWSSRLGVGRGDKNPFCYESA